jgi:hypothetical protein
VFRDVPGLARKRQGRKCCRPLMAFGTTINSGNGREATSRPLSECSGGASARGPSELPECPANKRAYRTWNTPKRLPILTNNPREELVSLGTEWLTLRFGDSQ